MPANHDEIGLLLAARLAWEAENPKPESLRKAERLIVRGLVAEGFGCQYQVTRLDSFEIAVDDLLIKVERIEPDPEPVPGSRDGER